MRKHPAVLLPLPLGEVASRSDDGEGEALLRKYQNAIRNFTSTSVKKFGELAKFKIFFQA